MFPKRLGFYWILLWLFSFEEYHTAEHGTAQLSTLKKELGTDSSDNLEKLMQNAFISYQHENRRMEAKSLLRKAFEDDPSKASRILREELEKNNKLEKIVDDDTLALLSDKELFYLGMRFFNEESFDNPRSIRYFTAAIDKNPNVAQYHQYRGHSYSRRGEMKSAFADFKEMTKLDPNNKQYRSILVDSLLDEDGDDTDDVLALLSDDELFKIGTKFSSESKYEKAIRYFTAAIGKNSNKAEYYTHRGLAYSGLGKKSLADSDFEKIVNSEPDDTFSNETEDDSINDSNKDESPGKLYELGMKYFNSKQNKKAIRYFTAAINKNSKIAEYYRFRGHAYSRMDEMESAVSNFEEMVKLEPNNEEFQSILSSALNNLRKRNGNNTNNVTSSVPSDDEKLFQTGMQYFEGNQPRKAIHYFTEAINKNAKVARYHQYRGHSYSRLNEMKSALSNFEEMVKLEPDNKEYWNILSSTLAGLNREDDAVNAILHAKPGDIAMFGERLLNNNSFHNAARCFTAAIEQEPTYYYYLQRGKCYMRLNKFHEATDDFRKSLELSPNSVNIKKLLSEALHRSGSAETHADEMLAMMNDVDEIVTVGQELFSENKFRGAIQYFTKALELRPSDTTVLRMRGLCFQNLNELDDAVKDLNAAVARKPNSVRLTIDLSNILCQMGKYDNAKKGEMYEKFLGRMNECKGFKKVAVDGLRQASVVNSVLENVYIENSNKRDRVMLDNAYEEVLKKMKELTN